MFPCWWRATVGVDGVPAEGSRGSGSTRSAGVDFAGTVVVGAAFDGAL